MSMQHVPSSSHRYAKFQLACLGVRPECYSMVHDIRNRLREHHGCLAAPMMPNPLRFKAWLDRQQSKPLFAKVGNPVF